MENKVRSFAHYKESEEKVTQAKAREVIYKMNAERGKVNRANGEEFEFRILRKFKCRSDVAFAIRSAGSHSAVDIIIQYKNGKQLWITAKKDGYMTLLERRAIDKLREIKRQDTEIRLYYYKSAKKMVYRTL